MKSLQVFDRVKRLQYLGPGLIFWINDFGVGMEERRVFVAKSGECAMSRRPVAEHMARNGQQVRINVFVGVCGQKSEVK